MSQDFLNNFIHYFIGTVPAFLIAILLSAAILEFLPEKIFEKLLSLKNITAIFLSSVVGALIPICTCGMIPLASKLYRKKTSWSIVLSFLTAGNASSITALMMTMVLGFKITVLRFCFAVVVGMLTSYAYIYLVKENGEPEHPVKEKDGHCESGKYNEILHESTFLLKEFGPWVLASIFIASLISMFLKPEIVINIGGVGNPFSSFIFSLVGFPFYFCAGTDIPISKALIEKGAGLGSILSFMTASPILNFTSLLIYQKWLGVKNTAFYLGIVFVLCAVLGGIVNFILLPITDYSLR